MRVADGAEVGRYEGHEHAVSRLAFSHDGRVLASSSWDGSVRLREPKTGADLLCLRGHKAAVASVVFSPDDKYIATCSSSTAVPDDNSIRIWDSSTGRQVRSVLRQPGSGIMNVDWSADGSMIVAGSMDNSILLYEVDTMEENLLGRHDAPVLSVAFSPNCDQVVSGSLDWTVRIWDVRERREVTCLRGHRDIVNSVCFAPDGHRVASASADRTVRVWEGFRSGAAGRIHDHSGDIVDIALSGDGSSLVSASRDGTIRLWDNKGVQRKVLIDNAQVAQVAVSKNACEVFSTDKQLIRIYDAQDGTERTARYSPIEARNQGRGWLDPSIQTVDGVDGSKAVVRQGSDIEITQFLLSSDEKQVVGGCWDGSICVWNTDDTTQVQCLSDPNERLTALSFFPQENRVIYAQEVTSLSVSLDDRSVVSGSADGTVRLWHLQSQTGTGHRTHRTAVTSIAIADDGSLVATGDADGKIILWRTADRRVVAEANVHNSAVTDIAFSHDGKSIISTSGAQTAMINDFANLSYCLLDGGGDAAAIGNAGSLERPWALVDSLETLIYDPQSGGAKAWYPAPVRFLRTYPHGEFWAGAEDNHIHMITMEGARPSIAGESEVQLRKIMTASTSRSTSTASVAAGKVSQSSSGSHIESFLIPENALVESLVPSPDATLAAYIARDSVGAHVEINGLAHPHYDAVSGLTFSADSTRLAYAAMRKNQWFVVCGEQEFGPFDDVGKSSPTIGPDSRQIAYAARRRGAWFVFIDNRLIAGPFEGLMPGGILFSPDSQRVAYVIKKGNRWHVMINSDDCGQYHAVIEQSPEFSPDSKRFAYIACSEGSRFFRKRTKGFLVVDGVVQREWVHDDKSGHEGFLEEIVFSPDSKRIAYAVCQRSKWFWIIDEELQGKYDGFVSGWKADPNWKRYPNFGKINCKPQILTFSPDSHHFAYAANRGGKHIFVCDGSERARHGAITNAPVAFSPDSTHFAYAAEENGKQFIMLDGSPLELLHGITGDRAFAPDSSMVAYIGMDSPDAFKLIVGSRKWEMSGGPMMGSRLVWDSVDTIHTLVARGRRVSVARYRVR
ncbi:MAG: hypothetical protein IT366_03095 [Candidatus Hydrogenedentes bacterium]|nr:hypothetical protein [Candidatus Hydrogenedentota bacterium]